MSLLKQLRQASIGVSVGLYWLWPLLILLAFPAQAESDVSEQQTLFQEEAFRQFGSRRTGEVYNVTVVEEEVPGVEVWAVRVRTGSLRRRGGLEVGAFVLPPGCDANTPSERILLVYSRVGNLSDSSNSSSNSSLLLYPIPRLGYRLVGPAVGLLAYDASALESSSSSSSSLSPLNVSATADNITITIPLFSPSLFISSPDNTTGPPLCVLFDYINSTALVLASSTLINQSGVCSTDRLGIFYLIAPLPSSPSPTIPTPDSNRWKLILGVVIGSTFLFLAMVLAIIFLIRIQRRRKSLSKLERHAALGETLNATTVRNTRTPAASSTRTGPAIESEYEIS